MGLASGSAFGAPQTPSSSPTAASRSATSRRASPHRARLAAAVAAYQRSDFATAERALGALLQQRPLPKGRVAQEAHTYLGFVHAAFGRRGAAIQAFQRALEIKPDLTLQNPSPKLARLFEQARKRQRARLRALDHDPPRLEHRPPRGPQAYGKPLRLEIAATDLSPIKTITLNYRIAGHRGFARLEMERDTGNRYVATIPTTAVVRPGVEYFIQAWDELGNGPGLKGSAVAPIRLEVEGGPLARAPKLLRRPWYKKWWVWAIAAGVVATAAAASVGAYLGRDQRGRITADGLGSLP